jgi:hypothetical protein
MSATPNQKYVSKQVPFGGVTVEIFRLADPNDNATGASLGNYKVESISPSRSSTLGKRPDVDGGKNGWWIVNGDVEGSAVIQRAVATTPSLLNGDYFSASVRVDNSLAPNGGVPIAERFVIHSPSEETGASYRKISCSVIVDDQV